MRDAYEDFDRDVKIKKCGWYAMGSETKKKLDLLGAAMCWARLRGEVYGLLGKAAGCSA